MLHWLTIPLACLSVVAMGEKHTYVETDLAKLPRVKDKTSERFDKLLVLSFAGVTPSRVAVWVCQCECGKVVEVRASNLRKQTSCGCEARKNVSKAATTHGMTNTTEFNIWSGMRKRCRLVTDKYYPRYGGKGIDMADAWYDSFERFYEDMGARPGGCSIDRIDNSKGYSKENCRWASPKQQNRNRNSNHLLTFRGESKCISEWAEQTGIRKDTLRRRICVYGWEVEKALTTNVGEYENDLL